MQEKDDYVPFPEYPNVTVKDIRELSGRNIKPMTDKEKAKMIYMFRKCDKLEGQFMRDI